MLANKILKSVCIAAILSLAGEAAHAGSAPGLGRSLRVPPASQFISTSRYTLAPFAFVRFCRDNRADCQAETGETTVVLTPQKRSELHALNSSINRSIRPVNDDASEGDNWQADVSSGDCEDFALTKRRHLIAQGWPARSLRIAVARTQSGEGHAVLVVKTTEGDLVLDNRFSAIRTWNKTDLNWVKIQSGDNPRLWLEI
jgi:predicted transglutaminase-like cysteine proteinase